VNEYDVGIFLIQHYDLYRLKSNYETKNIGLLENQKEILTLIEWPEKIDNKIDNKIDLFFEYAEDMNERFLSIKGLSEKKLNEIN
jgi:tRNA A37 threonylcarbamoyladenosine biosynthesis protein TsaE